MLIQVLLVGLLGLVLGGVVNLLADDLPARRSPHFPPRYPDDTPRPPTAWLGITAFLFGKRSSPGDAKLSWRYPLTELLTAGLMIIALLSALDDPNMTPLQFIFWEIYMVIFALIIVIDIEHRLILFVVIIPACVIAVIDAAVTNYGATAGDALIGGLLGFGVFFVLYLGGFAFTYVMSQVRGRKITEVAFGYGDVMLITFSGLILGWQPLLLAMFITVVLGALGAMIYLISRSLIGSRYSMFTALPYGPYIVVGTLLMLLFATEITAILT
ncbi:MAG: prepilin peptidase [Chloroflexi bacterium]|nr:prepilin peptidase [Chloroflexota bacterium]